MRSLAWPAACGLLVVATVGCGNQYKPVVTPVQPTGPAGQPEAYAVVTSQPDYNLLAVPTTGPCILSPSAANPYAPLSYSDTGVATVVDFSGDSIVAQALIGNGPLTLALDPTGGVAYAPNCDGTISYFLPSATLQTKSVDALTLLNYPAATTDAVPTNMLALSGTVFGVEQGHNAVAEMIGTPPALVQEIPVAPAFINMTGVSGAQRIYAISQGSTYGTSPAWGACSNPASVTTPGEADGLDLLVTTTSGTTTGTTGTSSTGTSTTTGTTTTTTTTVANQTVSSRLPVGVCPVYGVMTADGKRTFIMNRGSGTITVINSQLNAIDNSTTSPYVPNGTINLCNGATPCHAGPVYADLYTNGQLLVVANYGDGTTPAAGDGKTNFAGTISVIDISLDTYGNDSPTFGQVLATIPVGANPAALTVLQDGSRVYIANQGTTTNGNYNNDGAVTIVNLGTYTVEKTIPIAANPRSIASTYNYPEGKVYLGAPNSPYLTVIRTDTDILDTSIQMQGNITDVHTSTQYAGASTSTTTTNAEIQSHSSGSGAP